MFSGPVFNLARVGIGERSPWRPEYWFYDKLLVSPIIIITITTIIIIITIKCKTCRYIRDMAGVEGAMVNVMAC